MSSAGGIGTVAPPASTTATYLRCVGCDARSTSFCDTPTCEDCGDALVMEYDYEQARALTDLRALTHRGPNMWRYGELLPQLGAGPRVTWDVGATPLRRVPRLGRELGIAQLFVKDETVGRPTHSYKDRVVGVAMEHVLAVGCEEIACVSTGNVGTAVAAFAARAGIPAYVFLPAGVEPAKVALSSVYGAHTIVTDATYDELNAACGVLSRESGLQFVNISLRPIYAEGAKTIVYEIVEALDWRAPGHIVVPVAGATLATRVHRGLADLDAIGLSETAETRMHVAQPAGCAPVATAILENTTEIVPCVPDTIARSLAIGAPRDGGRAAEAVLSRGGTAAAVSDEEILDAVRLLSETEGIFVEPAGGTTVAATAKLAAEGAFADGRSVVMVLTGSGLKTFGSAVSDGRFAPAVDSKLVDLAPTLERLRAEARRDRRGLQATRRVTQ